MAKVEAEVKKLNKGEELRAFFEHVAEMVNKMKAPKEVNRILKTRDINLQFQCTSKGIYLIAAEGGKSTAIIEMTREEAEKLGILTSSIRDKIHDMNIDIRYHRTKEGEVPSKKVETTIALGKDPKGKEAYDQSGNNVYKKTHHGLTAKDIAEHVIESVTDAVGRIHDNNPKNDNPVKTLG